MNTYTKFYTLIAGLFIFIQGNSSPMNGNYTINPYTLPTATNFSNFFSANAYLTGVSRTDGGPNNSAPFGVSGPVVFNVAAGTYTEQFNLTGTVAGVSPVNTITFDGGNASSRVLSNSGTVSSYPTVIINNVPYVTIRNFTINAANTVYGFGVLITGASNGCRISNCNINVASNGYASLSGIVIGGTVTSYVATGRIDSLQIDSNNIDGGYNGISFDFNSSPGNPCLQNKIRNNKLTNFYYMGLFLYYQNGMNILNNKLLPYGYYNYNYGIYGYGLLNNGYNTTVISGNKISNFGYAAIYLYASNNTSGNKGFITNNMLGGGVKYAYDVLMLYSSNYWCVANNSINYDFVATSTAGFGPLYLATTIGISVMNNIFSVKQTGNYALPVYIPSTSYIDSMDYNIFYRADTSDHQLITLGATIYNTGNFKGGGGFNAHSLFLNPGFVNDTNLHTSAPCVRGITLPYITSDIDGNPRNSPPSFGANEVQRFPNDASPIGILQPTYPYATGPQNIRVRIANYGNNIIMNANVSYKLNANSPVTQTWYGILNPCDTVSVIFSGGQQANIGPGTNNIKIYTSVPNYVADGNTVNDTIITQFLVAMSGQYVIGTAPSDYTSFAAAVSDLQTLGIAGPVRFLVKTGAYNEAINIGAVTGASPTNTISFNSLANNRDSVTVNANGSYALTLNGASYISFKNITLNQLSSSVAGSVVFSGNIICDTLYNCKMSAPSASSTSLNIIYANGATLANSLIRKCLIQGGYSGLNMVSSSTTYSSNCVMDSNTLQGAYNGNSLQYFTNLKFRNNTLNINSNNNSVLIQNSNQAYEFSGNTVNVTSTYIATLYLTYNSAGSSGNRIKIFNNTFIAAPTAMLNLFAPFYFSGFVDFYNNSIINGAGFVQVGYNSNDARIYNNSISSSNSSNSILQNENGNSNIDCKNNIISNNNGGVAVSWTGTPSGTIYDYNNLYTTGANLVSVSSSSTNYTSLGAWRTASGMDKNSLSYRPGFTNASTNLTPANSDSACWSMNGRGMPQSFITSDINGNTRSSQTSTGATDIGAFEFTPTANPPAAVASPATPSAGTTQYFTFGSDTISSIAWAPASTVPSSVKVQLFSGANPPQLGSGSFYTTNAYWYITAPAGTYNYNLKLYYKKNWLFSIPAEMNMVITQKSTGINWGIASLSRSIDTSKNLMTANNLTRFSYFAGTDATTPLPVKWMSITANRTGNNVLLNWSTAGEINVDKFEIERSSGIGQWSMVGSEKARGNSNSLNEYSYSDDVFRIHSSIIYYRIKETDYNGSIDYSNTVSVNPDGINQHSIVVFPNPLSGNDQLFVRVNSNSTTDVMVELSDITGKTIISKIQTVSNGTNSIALDSVNTLQSGIYFLKTTINGIVQVEKVVKE